MPTNPLGNGSGRAYILNGYGKQRTVPYHHELMRYLVAFADDTTPFIERTPDYHCTLGREATERTMKNETKTTRPGKTDAIVFGLVMLAIGAIVGAVLL